VRRQTLVSPATEPGQGFGEHRILFLKLQSPVPDIPCGNSGMTAKKLCVL
jgi:hypothetical protein